jgi:E3 SUMO-protein ligase RanBP2
MILRRDQILKIACNHYINSSMTLNPMSTSETAICWYAVDFSDGNPIEEQFALKFKVIYIFFFSFIQTFHSIFFFYYFIE